MECGLFQEGYRMGDADKSKKQSTDELVELRRRVAELEALEEEHKRTDKKLQQ